MVTRPTKLVICSYFLWLFTVYSVTSYSPLPSPSHSSGITGTTCQQEQELRHFQYQPLTITEGADVYLGALLNVHNPGSGGFFGCGNVTLPGVVAYEALSWISATINQEHGLINGKKVVESFIPGVKIGMSIYSVTLYFVIIFYSL